MRYSTAVTGLAVVLAAFSIIGCSDEETEIDIGELLQFGKPSSEQQVAMTFDPDDPDRRREGIILLSKNDWGLAEPYLKGYAHMLRKDPAPTVRSAAVRALGKAGDTTYLPQIVSALADSSPAVRWDAAVVLDKVIGEAAVAPLMAHAVQDESADVRGTCAKALRRYAKPEVFETLLKCLADDSIAVRRQAHASLVQLTGSDAGYEPAGWYVLRGVQLRALAPEPKPGRPWWRWPAEGAQEQDESD